MNETKQELTKQTGGKGQLKPGETKENLTGREVTERNLLLTT